MPKQDLARAYGAVVLGKFSQGKGGFPAKLTVVALNSNLPPLRQHHP
jgi:hypothetical protein